MDPQDILAFATSSIDAVAQAAEPYAGLFPSMLDRDTGAMLAEAPEPIPGQRPGGRAYGGCNLIHDQALLKTMYALDRPGYADAADRCLRRFATHCTDSATGLFAWGEHASWDLIADRAGGGTGSPSCGSVLLQDAAAATAHHTPSARTGHDWTECYGSRRRFSTATSDTCSWALNSTDSRPPGSSCWGLGNA